MNNEIDDALQNFEGCVEIVCMRINFVWFSCEVNKTKRREKNTIFGRLCLPRSVVVLQFPFFLSHSVSVSLSPFLLLGHN